MGAIPESGSREWARYWQYAELPDLDLLRARYVRHAFPRHSHEGYVFGTISRGWRTSGCRAAPSTLAPAPSS